MNPKTRKERFIIGGGNAAGMSAASKAKRLNPNLEVLVFERSSHVSYSACGIPYYISDMMLVCAGIQPNSKIAHMAGARLGARNAIAVDWEMHTSVSNIFAAGNCAETQNIVSGKKDFLPSGPTANKQAGLPGRILVAALRLFPVWQARRFSSCLIWRWRAQGWICKRHGRWVLTQ